MKTEVLSIQTKSRTDIQIQITMSVLEVLDMERHFDRLLAEYRDINACNIWLGGKIALKKLGLNVERLMADDGNEHVFVPELHRHLEGRKFPMRILHMGKPLGYELTKEGADA